MTPAEKALLQQIESCQICEDPFWVLSVRQIDHDHETGLVRGVLCVKCNTTLGRLGDTVVALKLATTSRYTAALAEKFLKYLQDPPAQRDGVQIVYGVPTPRVPKIFKTQPELRKVRKIKPHSLAARLQVRGAALDRSMRRRGRSF